MPLQPKLARRTVGLIAALAMAVSLFAARPAFAGNHPVVGANAQKQWARFERPTQLPTNDANRNRPAFLWRGLAGFADSVMDGQPGVLRGVYVRHVLALSVIHQPAGAPFAVDLTPGTATQFAAASAYGVTGLLADNVASGTLFYSLQPGQEVNLVYGDGAIRRYVVTTLDRYQALSPTNPYSDFLSLATGTQVSASTLFAQKYAGGDKVTLQTCIAQDGVMSWGRLFVTAVPVY
jgi:hypothetical protein